MPKNWWYENIEIIVLELQVSRNKDGSMTLKLADFGLAMEVTEPIYTVCGTPTYVAPEILAETGKWRRTLFHERGVKFVALICASLALVRLLNTSQVFVALIAYFSLPQCFS